VSTRYKSVFSKFAVSRFEFSASQLLNDAQKDVSVSFNLLIDLLKSMIW